VLIDDLITKGTEEPYRMFTSRAEYRILLRQDNADQRLTPMSFAIGLASVERNAKVIEKYDKIDRFISFLENFSLRPEQVNALLAEKDTREISQKQKASTLLLRPQIFLQEMVTRITEIRNFAEENNLLDPDVVEETELKIKYESYITKEQELAGKLENLEAFSLDPGFDYIALTALSHEAREKLNKVKPRTIGQASRISGVSPADISVLIVYLGR
jgi:tRNA uridine 5-carboxymethylaminomethyl modification enzyme